MNSSIKEIILVAKHDPKKSLDRREETYRHAGEPVSIGNRTVRWVLPRDAITVLSQLTVNLEAIGLHSNTQLGPGLKKEELRKTYHALVGEYSSGHPQLWPKVVALLQGTGSGGTEDHWNAAYEGFLQEMKRQGEYDDHQEAYQRALPLLLAQAPGIPGSEVEVFLPQALFNKYNRPGDNWDSQTLLVAFEEWKKDLTAPESGEST